MDRRRLGAEWVLDGSVPTIGRSGVTQALTRVVRVRGSIKIQTTAF